MATSSAAVTPRRPPQNTRKTQKKYADVVSSDSGADGTTARRFAPRRRAPWPQPAREEGAEVAPVPRTPSVTEFMYRRVEGVVQLVWGAYRRGLRPSLCFIIVLEGRATVAGRPRRCIYLKWGVYVYILQDGRWGSQRRAGALSSTSRIVLFNLRPMYFNLCTRSPVLARGRNPRAPSACRAISSPTYREL